MKIAYLGETGYREKWKFFVYDPITTKTTYFKSKLAAAAFIDPDYEIRPISYKDYISRFRSTLKVL